MLLGCLYVLSDTSPHQGIKVYAHTPFTLADSRVNALLDDDRAPSTSSSSSSSSSSVATPYVFSSSHLTLYACTVRDGIGSIEAGLRLQRELRRREAELVDLTTSAGKLNDTKKAGR